MADIMRECIGAALLQRGIPLAAAVNAELGHILVADNTGLGRIRTSGTLVATDTCVGVVAVGADNSSGAASAKRATTDYMRAIWLPQSSTDPVPAGGRQAYVESSEAVCTFRVDGVNVPCGEVLERTSTQVLVLVGAVSAADIAGRVEVLEGY